MVIPYPLILKKLSHDQRFYVRFLLLITSFVVLLLLSYYLLWSNVQKWRVSHRQYQVLVQQYNLIQDKRRDHQKQQAYLQTLPKAVVQRLLIKKSLSVSSRLRYFIGVAKRCQCQLKTLLLKPAQEVGLKQQQLKLKLQGRYTNLMCFVKEIGQSPLYCWFNDLNLKTNDATGRLSLNTLLEL